MARRQRRNRGEGALFYRADRDRWIGRITVDGTQRSVSARTKTEARHKLDQLRRAADDGITIPPGNVTVAELLDLWADKALPNRSLSPSALATHQWAIRILTHELGRSRLRALSVDDVEAALARRTTAIDDPSPHRGRGRAATSALSRNSLIKLRSTLSQALAWGMRRDLVARNVAAIAELPPTTTERRAGKSLTIDQVRRFLTAADDSELESMWLLMLYLGLRPGEAAGLSWRDIDLDHGTIHVWRARTTNHDGSVTVGATKTPGSVRTLDAPAPVLTALQRHRYRQQVRAAELGELWSNPDELVFTSPTGKPADPAAVRREFQHIITAADIDGHWTPNLLRHTAASLMAHAGMPIETVADQLGHRDLRMLQQHYRHRIQPTIGGGQVVGELLDHNDAAAD